MSNDFKKWNPIKWIKKEIQKIPEEKNLIMGLLMLFIVLWAILYLIPGIFTLLFTTFLGNIIILLFIVLVSIKNIKYGLGIVIIFVILHRISIMMTKKTESIKEGFQWSQQTSNDFLLLEKTINPNIIFDLNITQQQASEDEVKYLLENGHWPWSKEVQNLYMNASMNNTFIRNDPGDSLMKAQTIYNQAAILELLSLQTKEGSLLINGVDIDVSNNQTNDQAEYAYTSGLIPRNNSIIKCNTDNRNNASMEQIFYGGVNSILNTREKKVVPLDYNDLENKIPGFQFVNSPCNPCMALNASPEYTCPFTLKTKNSQDGKISSVWQYLWNLNTDPLNTPISEDRYSNINQYPLLNELQVELNNIFPSSQTTSPTPQTTTTSLTTSQTPVIITNSSA